MAFPPTDGSNAHSSSGRDQIVSDSIAKLLADLAGEPRDTMCALQSLIVERAVPLRLITAVTSGIAQIHGGTIRDTKSGRILAHLVEVSGRLGSAGSTAGAKTLSELASRQLIATALGTAALSGLTLAVGTASWAFLAKRISAVETRLLEVQRDVKSIRLFLETKQRAELVNALKTLRDANDAKKESVREQLLVESRQELGSLAAQFSMLMKAAEEPLAFEATEEYFTLSALGHARCTAELGMAKTAADDYQTALDIWRLETTEFSKKHLLEDDPQRFLGQRYAEVVGVDQIAAWMTSMYGKPETGNWIDDLRRRPVASSWWTSSASDEDRNVIRLLDKIAARQPLMDSYSQQFRRLEERQAKPSEFLRAIEEHAPHDVDSEVLVVMEPQPEKKIIGTAGS